MQAALCSSLEGTRGLGWQGKETLLLWGIPLEEGLHNSLARGHLILPGKNPSALPFAEASLLGFRVTAAPALILQLFSETDKATEESQLR